MPNYQNAKVYKLVGNGKIYIGSTTQKLCRRKAEHNTKYRRNCDKCTSYEIVSDPNHYIELIENVSCNSKEELFIRERYWIDNTECVNKCIPYRTKEEKETFKKEQDKKYKENNKDIIKERNKQYYQANKDKINEKQKQYREDNKDNIKEWKKKYREANKDKIKEYSQKRYQEKKAQSNNIIED